VPHARAAAASPVPIAPPPSLRHRYERAIANIPPVFEKKYWKRYIYLWINYALFEELETKDYARCRDVFKQCLAVVPHK
jgi:crooked neck